MVNISIVDHRVILRKIRRLDIACVKSIRSGNAPLHQRGHSKNLGAWLHMTESHSQHDYHVMHPVRCGSTTEETRSQIDK